MTKDKTLAWLKDKSFTLILSVLMIVGVFVKDTFFEGAEKKFNDKVIFVIESEDVKPYLQEVSRDEIKKAMNDPFIWFDALSSDFVGDFAENKAKEVQNEVEKRLIEIDSIQRNFINDLGEAVGVRNEDVSKLLKNLLKDYKEGNLSRSISARF